ncbi:Heavy-metal-associated domain protein [Quillaja saponaria]|uniref:Heavy-metal-associated domain protein n=1 Tax=Quillaja saponaria TaxID=32244 RepID=A0AAD7VLM1_QUISA|nr:Heavy-metal-associated domain protein [Quillaja saponaria]
MVLEVQKPRSQRARSEWTVMGVYIRSRKYSMASMVEYMISISTFLNKTTQPPEQEPADNAPAPDAAQPPQAEAPPAEATLPIEPQKDPPPPEKPPAEPTPSLTATESNVIQNLQSTTAPKDVGEVHVIYHHPPNYGYRYGFGPNDDGQSDRHHNSQVTLQEPPPPIYVTHSHNTYKPSPYVTEYEYVRSPPRYTNYSPMEHYNKDYRSGNNGNGNITSIFSDENPNACSIV